MHVSLTTTGKWLVQVVRGYFQYHAIPGNWARLKAFRNDVLLYASGFKRFGGEASAAV
jgi:RNA-directed DNA polymerase